MAIPVAAHTFDFRRIYLSSRTGGAPGSGVWSDPTVIFDTRVANPELGQGNTFSAGALTSDPSEPRGIVVRTDFNSGSSKLCYIANGLPDTPTPVAVTVGPFESFDTVDYWDVSQGAWSHNGDLYLAGFLNESPSETWLIKSTDNGASWNRITGANSPPGDGQPVAVQRIDDKIYFFAPSDHAGTGNFAIYAIDLATDAWDAPIAALNATIFQGNNIWSNGLMVYANGDIGIVYINGAQTVYREFTLGTLTWGSEIVLPGQAYANLIVDPSRELLHVFVYDGVLKSNPVIYSTVAHGGTVTPSIFTIPAFFGITDGDGVNHCSIQQGMMFVPRDDPNDFANAVWVALLSDGQFVKELLPVPADETNVIKAFTLGLDGSGYVVGDTGTIDGGAPNFLATYQITDVETNAVHSVAGSAPGTGYVAGNEVTIDGGSPLAILTITSTDMSGGVTGVDITYAGGGYSVASGVGTTIVSGVGTGFTVDILSLFSGVTGLNLTDRGGGYSVASGVGTTTGGAQPGVGTGLTINITEVGGKLPSCAYMMFPNGFVTPTGDAMYGIALGLSSTATYSAGPMPPAPPESCIIVPAGPGSTLVAINEPLELVGS